MKHIALGLLALLLAAVFLAACGNLPQLQIQQPTPTGALATTAPTPTSAPTEPIETLAGPITLTIWIPPQFDPTDGTEAGTLLQQRLDQYGDSHPGLRVLVRLKAETGESSLLKSLQTTQLAAPLALPDLVLLSTKDMANAADANLVYPFPAGFPAENDLDWYNVATLLGTYNNQRYGLPLAADALTMTYKVSQVEEAPTSWSALLESGYFLTFPAANIEASFSLAGYLSSGGELLQDDHLTLQQDPLRDLFNFYADAAEIDVFPFWITQYDSDKLSWPTFSEGTAELAITWATRYFRERTEAISATTLPTQSGTPYTLANGWIWAIAAEDPNRQAAAAELAAYLSASEFVSGWTQATGYMPLRPSALASWPEGPNQALASQLLPAAEAFPPPSIILQVSPPLSEVVIDLIKDEQTPEGAVEQMLEALGE